MTAHEKECALAALALLIERARKSGNRKETRECRKMYREILAEPLE